ncbi:unnamed protein product [Sphagnum jensenii]|uniref:SBP-type domain-containing protein n=1 Tax=Sphagnum jensenii TaxID=128206 RepID=A0ABP0X6M2_9BRYO
MNSSANTSNLQGDPNWATVNWDQSGATGSLDQTTCQYTANRSEWLDCDPMILAQHPGSGCSSDCGDGDCKNHLTHAGTVSRLRAYNMLSSRLPPNFTQTSMGTFNSAAMWNYATVGTSGNIPTPSAIHTVLGSSDIPGLAATGRAGLHGDLQSSFHDQQHQEFYAGMQQDHHMVKREDISHCYTGLSMNGVRTQQNVTDGFGTPLGLNLGVRTYFSMDDNVVGQLVKRHRAGSPGSRVPMCQAEGCKADLSTAKHYHRRHKVCELHSKAPNVVASGHPQRFCQQCSRFHFLGEFDNGKRSCRKRLADHNRRRRKPQPCASTSETIAECMGMKGEEGDPSGSHATDRKSMLLKKSGSPSSASLEESDEHPGSAGNKLQLHTSGATLGRAPGEDQHSTQSVMRMTSQPMRSSEAQSKLLPAMSTSPPAPPMPHNAEQHQLPMMTGTANHSQGATVYQQYLQGFNPGQSGPCLSLSSLGGQGHQPQSHGQPMPGQTYKGIDAPVPWIKIITSQASDLDQVVGRPGVLNLQHLTDSKIGQSPHQSITSAAANSNTRDPDAQVFPPNDQNLLPLQISSGDITGSEWTLRSLTGEQNPGGEPNHFGPSSHLLRLSGSGQLEGQQILETSTLWAAEGSNSGKSQSAQNAQDGQTPMEVLQQHNTGTGSGRDHSTLTLGSAGGLNLKYHELHILRPFGTSSIYDSHQAPFTRFSSDHMV